LDSFCQSWKAAMLNRKEFQQRAQTIEELVAKLESISDPDHRAATKHLLHALTDLYGSGIERMMELAHQMGAPGAALIESFERDDIVKGLLLLHGLHSQDLESRLLQALEKTRPYLKSHGGNVELVSVNDAGVVKLRLEGSCHGCPSSSVTMKLAIEDAIYEAAPDILALEVEGVAEEPVRAKSVGFVPIEQLSGNAHKPAAAARDQVEWEEIFGLDSILPGIARKMDAGGKDIVVCRVNEALYAYENSCAACGKSLEGALLDSTTLVCPSCERQFDIVRAGRSLHAPNLHLLPLPLLAENGRARVAVPLAAIARVEGAL
jgi:Fe-S cluster biogenesis protein NfuA/nitrite reductase/ring-hydroxylating ferredoxin subunit